MGGDIEVDSQPGRGSRFWFDLDLPAGRRGAAAARRRARASPATRARAAACWWSTTCAGNRAVLVDLLGSLGFEVREADDGDAALRMRARPSGPTWC